MKLSKKNLFTALLGLLVVLQGVNVSAQSQIEIPDGYYDKANGLAGAELKTALHLIIKGGTRLTYGSGPGKTWSGFEKTDKHPDGYVWDMYSNNKRYFPGNAGVPGGMNIEHSVAKSWWGGTNNNAYKDLYHLNPSDADANSARSNYPPGIVTVVDKVVGTLKIGNNSYKAPGTSTAEYTEICFEPLDEYKGDFARAYLYMFTSYEDLNWTGTKAPTMIVANQKYPMLRNWAYNMLVEWCRQDPVSEKEINRASEIYKIQKNRNPFIDYPELVEYLWGNKKGEAFEFAPSTDPRITAPSNGTTFTMPETSYVSTSTFEFKLKGLNLTNGVTLTQKGAMQHLFTLSKYEASPVNGTIDETITITFNPEGVSTENMQIVIASNNSEFADVTINVNATANENFYALQPTDITSTSFVANWTPLSTTNDFDLDVYTKTVSGTESKILANSSFNNALDAGWTTSSNGYTTLTEEKGAIRLASGSKGGGVITPAVDLSEGGMVTFTAKSYGTDKSVNLTIKVDDETVESVLITSTYAEYSVALNNYSTTSKVSINAVADKRAYVADMTVLSQGEKVVKTSLPGYPIRKNGVTSHLVENLENNQDYFYTVTPFNSSWGTSDEVKATTTNGTGINEVNPNNIVIYYSNNYIHVDNCEKGDIIFVYNIDGKVLYNSIAEKSNHQIYWNNNGIYIVKVYNNGKTYSSKLYTTAYSFFPKYQDKTFKPQNIDFYQFSSIED